MEKVGDIRRMRVKFLGWHNPKCWAAYYEEPGAGACYCHADRLEDLWWKLEAYFKGYGHCQPLRIEPRFAAVLR